MATYGYLAIDRSGKELKGSIDSDNEKLALATLWQQNLIPIELKEQNLLTKDIQFDFASKVTSRDLSVFCRQFHSMIKAGVTIIEALRLMEEQTESKKLKRAIQNREHIKISYKHVEEVYDNLKCLKLLFIDNNWYFCLRF